MITEQLNEIMTWLLVEEYFTNAELVALKELSCEISKVFLELIDNKKHKEAESNE